MPRTDLLEASAPRVELDQRSREARLRLEHVERLLVVRPLPRQSLLRRVLRRLRGKLYMGDGADRQSGQHSPSREPRGSGEIPGETIGVTGGRPAAPPASWPHCRGYSRETRRGQTG